VICLTTMHSMLNFPQTPDTYTLSLHDALPIFQSRSTTQQWPQPPHSMRRSRQKSRGRSMAPSSRNVLQRRTNNLVRVDGMVCGRSEEHTSELQSRFDLVCRLLLDKKKT